MNIYELEKQATPGPLAVTNDCCGYAALAMTEMGESVFGGCGDKGDANVRFAAHCRNNFMRALEFIKDHGPCNGCSGRDDHMCGRDECLIAELEEVK